MSIALIAAISQNNCIGQHNALPWHIPEDMEHFKNLTKGKAILMGRKTWESLPEKFRPLPGRLNIVITRQKDYPVPKGVLVFDTIDAACTNPELRTQNSELMVIGGADIYRQTIDRADTLYITHVNKDVPGDAFFPMIDPTVWKETWREDHEGFSFVTYGR